MDIVISFEPVVRARRALLASFALLAAFTAPGLTLLQLDNSPEGFFVRDHEALEAFERLEADFGRDRGVRLVIEGEALWTRAGLVELARLEGGLSAADDGGLGGVYATAGPWRHHRWHLASWPPDDIEAFRRLVLSDPVDRDAGWVSPDASTVTMIVGLFKMLPARRTMMLEAIRARLDALEVALAASASNESAGISAYVVGLPMVSYTVDRAQVRVLRIIIPLLVLVAALLLAVLFRSPAGVLAPLALVAMTQVVVLGLLGYAGQRIDFVTLLLVPLTLVIALATGVHVVAYHRRLRQAGVPSHAAVVETYRVKAWPVLWTGMTTSAGFASLAISSVPSVQALGAWTAFGIAFMTLAALSFYPALLASLGHGKVSMGNSSERWTDRRIRGLVHSAVAHPRAVHGAFAAIALLALLGLPRLSVDTSVLSYFAPSHPLRARIERLEQKGLPAVTASLVLDAGENAGSFHDPPALERLTALSEELRAEPLVTGAISAGDLASDVARHLGLPFVDDGRARLAEAQDLMDEVSDLRELRAAVVADDGRRTRLVLFLPMRGYVELEALFRRAEAAAQRAFPEARARVTGEYPLVLAAQRSLLRTMIISLLATFAVIAATLRWLLGSNALTLRSLVPNVWPVLIVLGAMGWLAIPIDSTTVMVAAIVLGLAVDDTLHTLGHLRLRAGAFRDTPAGALVEGSLSEVARGHLITSMILCLGFLVPMLSELAPVARFGMLSALAVGAALAADLLLVPALLAGADARDLRRLAPDSGGPMELLPAQDEEPGREQ